ncbi:MAG: GIY-YIG nuclease family protein, partial [Dolichospermum sp.]
PEEQDNYQNIAIDEIGKSKVLKNVARRVEEEILAILEARGLKTQMRFNPKLKEVGLLDLK